MLPNKADRSVRGGSPGGTGCLSGMPSCDLGADAAGGSGRVLEPGGQLRERFFADNDTAPMMWLEQVRTPAVRSSYVRLHSAHSTLTDVHS